jgi:uncharacterized protein YbgA (DUF1722 family)/uncharacterized protein YbbK (DUF523 family)
MDYVFLTLKTFTVRNPMAEKIKIGISSCLLGYNVRYDGGHKLDRFLRDTLGRYVEYVPVCPEVEYGLGTPRESLHLVGDPASPRLITTKTQRDHTAGMLRWARKKAIQLRKEDLCGFIFKSKSPSSGMERVKVYGEGGMPVNKGTGLFAGVFMDHFPLVPVEEEGRLHDLKIRENFIERIFALRRWRKILQDGKSRGRLVDFHTRNKLLILAHSPKHYREMGNLVAESKKFPNKFLYERYERLLMESLRLKTTPKKNINVLQHIMGYFKKQLPGDEKLELLEILETYREGNIPLIVPITIMNHFVRKYDEPYLKKQTYLNPHPIALQLRNHV